MLIVRLPISRQLNESGQITIELQRLLLSKFEVVKEFGGFNSWVKRPGEGNSRLLKTVTEYAMCVYYPGSKRAGLSPGNSL
jgi:hypothetical protein